MAEHVDKPERTEQLSGEGRQDEDVTRAMSPQPPAGSAGASSSGAASSDNGSQRAKRRRAASSVDWAKAKDQIVGLLAGVVRWLGVIFAVILVLEVIFVIGEANEDNGIATFVRNWSEGLAVGFENLFTPDDAKLQVLVNYGIAAIFWLVVSSIVAKIIRRIGDSIDV